MNYVVQIAAVRSLSDLIENFSLVSLSEALDRGRPAGESLRRGDVRLVARPRGTSLPPIAHAILRTKRALPYRARMLVSPGIAWIGKIVITYYSKTPFFPISANFVAALRD